MMTPINLITSIICLYNIIGFSFVFGLSLLVICFYVDRKVRDQMYEMHFEMGKIREKKGNLTNESFESIKTIKLYGWDSYFHNEIKKLMAQETEKEMETNYLEMSLEFMWNFLPRLIAPVTFVVFMSRSYTIGFSDMMEVVMLLGRVQGPLHHLNHIQD